jgi:hypothetical protein
MYHWETSQKSDRIQFIVKIAWFDREVSEKVRREELSCKSIFTSLTSSSAPVNKYTGVEE